MIFPLARSLRSTTPPQCVRVPGTRTATMGDIRRTELDFDASLVAGKTLYTNLMERRLVDDGSRPIFGIRKIDPVTKVAGDYEWVTYNAFLEQVEHVSAAMVHELGLQRQEPVGVFSKNRYEWVLVEHGTSRMSYQLVPLYDTLGPKAIPFILNQTEMRVVFCGRQQFAALMSVVTECPSVKIVVQFEDVDEEQRKVAATKHIKLKSLGEIMEVGKAKPVEADPPLPEDVVTISYTSGTTGTPKGVVLTHANAIAASVAIDALNPIHEDDVHLSYLPLAHVLERGAHTVFIRCGGAIGFFQGDLTTLLDDFAALRPTIFLSVPRLFNRIHDRILQGIKDQGGVKQWLFNWAFSSKQYALTDGYVQHSLWDTLVFNRVKQLLGGRVRLLVNGSAPLSRDCKEFLQIAFACPIVEGYGMTETYAAIAFSTPAIAPGSHVGVPAPGVEVRLCDVPELQYTSEDVPCPRGEICVRGPTVFRGYYKDPRRTAEVLDEDGWLHTGDIGQWNPDGTLSIIDRKKNIFKLAQGEYVAPEKIENVYSKSPLVAQIFVHGDSLQSYLVGFVIPDEDAVRALWAREKEREEGPLSFADLCTRPELDAAIRASFDALEREHGLLGFERVRKLYVHHEPWTAQNDLATPTFKLKRPQLVAYYAAQVNVLYATAC